jgi:hypothetical protein
MTGPITLASDPTAALQPATKQYVDATNIRYRNRIINGDMSVDQRNGGALVTMPASGAPYIIDRWRLQNGNAMAPKGACGQQPLGGVLGQSTTMLTFTTQTAYPSPVAADSVRWFQQVEGVNFNDANWGTASAQPIVLEFQAYANTVAGTYAVALQNYAAARCYIATFTLPAATWTKVRLNIPGDTTGAWSVAATAGALTLSFPLCVGSTYTTSTLNSWQAGNFYNASGAVNVLATLNATFEITNVALMVGAAAANAEPEFRKYSDNLIDCKRYFTQAQAYMATTGNVATGAFGAAASFPVAMRTSATLVVTTNSSANFTYGGMGMLAGLAGAYVYGTSTAAGQTGLNIALTADADF